MAERQLLDGFQIKQGRGDTLQTKLTW